MKAQVARLRHAALPIAILSLASSITAQGLGGGIANAQSPTPNTYMYDSYPGNSFPTAAPYEGSNQPGAVVVEGLYPCEGSRYSTSSVENATRTWVNGPYGNGTQIRTITAHCQSLTAYENELKAIESYVAQSSNASAYWAGFMLDEEPGYGFTASQLESLNAYTESLMNTAPGASWYFTENQPNGWTVATYNAIVKNSWLAPQAYTSSMISAIKSECSTYRKCTNNLTIASTFSYPYDNYQWVTAQVSGSPWTYSDWTGYRGATLTWCNYWRPQ